MPKPNLRQLDLNLLVVFADLWDTRSVTRSSERLALSQPAVSHALKRLRESLHDELFVQSRSGLLPTAVAQQLILPVRAALDGLQQALFSERSFNPSIARCEFRVAASEVIELSFVPALFERVRRLAPGVVLRVRVLTDENLLQAMLEDGELHVVIGGHQFTSAAVRSVIAAQLTIVALLSKSLRIPGPRLPLDVYTRLPHIVMMRRGHHPAVVDQVLAAQGLSRTISASVDNYSVMALAAAKCGFICHLPKVIAAQVGAPLGLQVYELPIDLEPSRVVVTSHVRSQSDPATGWLLKQVTEVLVECMGKN